MSQSQVVAEEGLEEVFSAFTSTAQGLERAFQDLKQRADRLDLELYENNRQMEALFAAFPSGVVAADKEGRINRVNPAAATLLGLAPETRQGVLRLVDFRDCNGDPLFFSRPVTEDRKLGDPRDPNLVRVSYVPLSHQGGDLWILEDRTRLEELEVRVKHLDQLASLGRMALSIAHEIRNPLGAVAGFAGLLRRSASGEKEERYCRRITEGVGRVDAIIRNLLAFARPSGLTLQRLDLAALVRKVQSEWAGGSLHLDLPAGMALVEGDETALRQVLDNLLRNAREAGAGEIDIDLERRGCSWLLAVEDDGPGILSHLRQEIFEPFRSEKEKGTGLGLAIVHRVVELHHGRVAAVDPVKREGARIEVDLPAEADHER